MRSQVQEKLAFDQNRSLEQVIEIPISYTYFRSASGQTGGAVNDITNTYIDARIDFMNEKFVGSGIQFYRLGNVNFIDNELFFMPYSSFLVRENYSYVKTALNVYICPNCGPFTNQPGSELYGAPVKHNTSLLRPSDYQNYSNYIHETGHNFGLLHTFGPVAKENGEPIYFDYPRVITDNQVYDHPEFGIRRRELAIRIFTPGKAFDQPNCLNAGDFCCDTEADCSDISERTFPDFDPSNVASCLIPNAPCAGGCSVNQCTYAGTYKDYNGDLIPGCFNNIMSYHIINCAPPIFTTEQKGWIAYNYDKYWNNWLEDLPININDKVEVRGSALPIRDVVIRWKHQDPSRYTNCTSNATGDFQGVLYDDFAKAEVRKIGSTTEVAGSYQAPGGPIQYYFKDAYTYADWIKDIDAQDLIRIFKHANGSGALNGDGYNLIAADANKSNTITIRDYITLKKLLLGQIQKLPDFDAPWRFVPEYVPQDNLAQFNEDPFNMSFSTINGQDPTGTPYTEPTWEYEVSAVLNKRGYDGIKIGDVYGTPTSPAACEEAPELSFPSAPLMAPGQNFDIIIKASGFTGVEAFQLGVFVDHSKLQVLDVSSANLPEFSKADHAGLDLLENNQLNMVWFQSNTQTVSLSSQAEFLKLKINTLQPITDLSAAINLSGDLPSKIFKSSGCNGASLQGFVAPSTSNRPNGHSKIEQAKLSNLYCYPNPIGEHLNISFESNYSGQGVLQLIDMNGKSLFAQTVDVAEVINTLSVDPGELSSLPAGVLSVTLQTDTNVFTGRLVKL